MMTRFSTSSGANLFLSGETILPATENTFSLLLEVAGMAKRTLIFYFEIKATTVQYIDTRKFSPPTGGFFLAPAEG